jgi:hypothetical protein
MNTTHEGRVVKILGDSSFNVTEIVVNLGSEHGISSATEFLVYQIGDEIKDPVTGESLGRLEVVRGQGKAKHVQPKMTTVEGRKIRRGKRVRKPSSLFGGLVIRGDDEIIEDLSSIEPFEDVEVGDLVRVLG